jgi:small acid-soluble spore protein I (minor)
MNINLRQAIVQKVQDKTIEELQGVIEDSIGGDDHALPGLGVLFEIIWEHSEDATRQELVQTLKANLVH